MFLVVEDMARNDVFDLPEVSTFEIPRKEFEVRGKVEPAANMELDLSCMKFNVSCTTGEEKEQRFKNHTEMIVYRLNQVVEKEFKDDEGRREALAVLYRNAGPTDLDLRMRIVAKNEGRRAI